MYIEKCFKYHIDDFYIRNRLKKMENNIELLTKFKKCSFYLGATAGPWRNEGDCVVS